MAGGPTGRNRSMIRDSLPAPGLLSPASTNPSLRNGNSNPFSWQSIVGSIIVTAIPAIMA